MRVLYISIVLNDQKTCDKVVHILIGNPLADLFIVLCESSCPTDAVCQWPY